MYKRKSFCFSIGTRNLVALPDNCSRLTSFGCWLDMLWEVVTVKWAGNFICKESGELSFPRETFLWNIAGRSTMFLAAEKCFHQQNSEYYRFSFLDITYFGFLRASKWIKIDKKTKHCPRHATSRYVKDVTSAVFASSWDFFERPRFD